MLNKRSTKITSQGHEPPKRMKCLYTAYTSPISFYIPSLTFWLGGGGLRGLPTLNSRHGFGPPPLPRHGSRGFANVGTPCNVFHSAPLNSQSPGCGIRRLGKGSVCGGGNHWKIDTGSTYDTYDTNTADTIDQYNCTKKIAVQWRGRLDKHH